MFRLPDLPYDYAALAPVISEATLRTHHGKHHARYVQVTNELLEEANDHAGTLEAVIGAAARDGAHKLFNNAAQAWNHGFFWECMTPGGSQPSGPLVQAVAKAFGGLDQLKQAFTSEGAAHFGSGWVWLVADGDQLSVRSTHDAGTPIIASGLTPILVCDLWEHAYYLDHRNDRAGFLSAWWDLLVDWDFAAGQYAAATERQSGWRYQPAIRG